MIELHRLNNTPFFLNYRHIEVVEAFPDTVITLTNDKKYIVKEKPEEVARLIAQYHRKIFQGNFMESTDV